METLQLQNHIKLALLSIKAISFSLPRLISITTQNTQTTMISIDELTINQVHDAYKFGEYSCADLVSAYLDQVAKNDQAGPRLNAITIVSLAAIEDAIALDDYFKENGTFIGPLHGVPVIVKDQCDTKGLETTYGNICCKHVPSEDATLVKKLRDAGAVILAKSTMPGEPSHFLFCQINVLTNTRLRSIIQLLLFSQWRNTKPIHPHARNRRLKRRHRCRYSSKLWSHRRRRRYRRLHSSPSIVLQPRRLATYSRSHLKSWSVTAGQAARYAWTNDEDSQRRSTHARCPSWL